MCQPLPGPRCASHAKAELRAARTARADAKAASEAAWAAYEPYLQVRYWSKDEDPEAVLTYKATHAAHSEAVAAATAAEAAYDEALRNYESTPTGQKDLAEAIDRLTAEGDMRAAHAARQRLAEAQAWREQQIIDLAIAERQSARLAALNAEEADALAEADAAVAAADREIAAHESVLADARERQRALEADLASAQADLDAAHAVRLAAREEVLSAQRALAAEAVRLYVEAGADPARAEQWAQDMIAGAARPANGIYPKTGYSTDGIRGAENLVEAPPMMFDRPREHYRDRYSDSAEATPAGMVAGAYASRTDASFQAAKSALMEKVAAHRQARQAVETVKAGRYSEVVARFQRGSQEVHYAQKDIERLQSKRESGPADRARRLRAQIGSGAGSTPATSADLSRVTNEIVRQPDGSTNAMTYVPPAPGLPYGYYRRVTGVQVNRGGQGNGNVLIFDDGSTAVMSAHSRRTGPQQAPDNAGRSRPSVALLPAAPGSSPLNDEGIPGVGYQTIVDSNA